MTAPTNVRYATQRLLAPNDANGNPRRLIVVYDLWGAFDPVVACIDEGYGGAGHTRLLAETAERGLPLPEIELPEVNIGAAEYRLWKRANPL